MTLQLVNGPSATDIYEGLRVDMTGARFLVRYTDNTYAYITDVRQLSVFPIYYDSMIASDGPGIKEYTVSYAEGGRIVSYPLTATVTEGGAWIHLTSDAAKVNPLIGLVYTGSLAKQEYNVDDIPDFKGVTIEGRYGDKEAISGAHPSNGSAGTEYDFIQKVIPVTSEYPWRWVWNNTLVSTGQPGSGTGFREQDPGILLSIGSFGYPDFDESGIVDLTDLKGLRIPVAKLYQVDSLEFVTAPSFSSRQIFFDDPTLIGRDTTSDDWMDMLNDVVLRVNYQKGAPSAYKDFTARELQTIGIWGGLWGDRNKSGSTYGGQGGSLEINFVNSKGAKYTDGGSPATDIIMLPGEDVGGDTNNTYWESWAREKEPKIRFQYRDKHIDAVVPVYNKLISITIESNSGELVVISGADRVYHGPEGIGDILKYATVTATYSGNAATNDVPGVRSDVDADISAGICDGAFTFTPDDSTLPASSKNYEDKGKEIKATATLTVDGAFSIQQSKKATINIGAVNYQ